MKPKTLMKLQDQGRSERWYRRLLTLLPRDLRQGFGDDMTALFLERLAEARGRRGRLWVWLRAASDLAVGGLIEQSRARQHRREAPRRSEGAPMNALFKDIGYAIRRLVKNPSFALITVFTLALGIGASTVAFSLVNGVLMRPLPFPESDRLMMLEERRGDGRELILSYPNFDDWRRESETFEGILAVRVPIEVSVTGGAEPTRGTVITVSREFFDVLGVQPVLGRPIAPEENRPGGEPVVVLSYEFWTRLFGDRPSLEGASITMAGDAYPVVGVMPRGFKLLEEADVYFPGELSPPRVRDSHNYRAVGRLAPGVVLSQAQEEMNGIAARIREAYPGETDTESVSIRSLRAEILGEVDRPLLFLLGAAGLLLMLACSNVASALLARNSQREREMAIRAAVGAARLRLIQQLFTESLLTAGLAGLLGLLLSILTLDLVRAQGVDLVPRLQTVSIDANVMLFALGATLVTSLLFGLLPALRVSDAMAGALRSGQRGDTGRRKAFAWDLLVGGEAALSVVLLVACGLLVRSFQQVISEETHFRPERVLTVEMDLAGSGYANAEERAGLLEELKQEYEALPGVTAVGFVNHLPTESNFMTGPVFRSPAPRQRDPDRPGTNSGWRVVDEDYFAALGIPLVRGRFFSREDRPDGPPVAILNQALADQAFSGQDPIGRQVQVIPFWLNADLTVVGVVAEARDWRKKAGSQPEIFVYLPQQMDYSWYWTCVIRTAGDPASLVGPTRERLRAIAPAVPADIQTMTARLGESLSERRFTLGVLGSFAALSLVLAGIGIFGVVSYAVSSRSREIGIRLALGAGARTLRQRIFWPSFGVVALGTGVGVVCAFAFGGTMESLLYEVTPRDPVAFAAAALVVLIAAALAIWVPVMRYTRVDPVVTMRAE
jgi:predicted permease